jgi:hypothetical protein
MGGGGGINTSVLLSKKREYCREISFAGSTNTRSALKTKLLRREEYKTNSGLSNWEE